MNFECQRAEQTGPLVLNFYAGPGSGKSTMAAGCFHELKSRGVNCELVTEYAKDKTWEGSPKSIFNNQLYIFGKQHHRQFRLIDNVDVIITDSPLLLSIHYANFYENPPLASAFEHLVSLTYFTFNNMNFFVDRVKEYNPKGRNQTEAEAKAMDREILDVLDRYGIERRHINGSKQGLKDLMEILSTVI